MWRSWQWDWVTFGWAVWLAYFAVLETIALCTDAQVHPLTAHVRPILNSSQVGWFLGIGLWLWIFFHFLWPIPPVVFGGK